MTNIFEQRLHEIQLLIHTYRTKDSTHYKKEIQKLEAEKQQILQTIDYLR